LKSIEDHIRLKDPELHKAKLLELLGIGEREDRDYWEGTPTKLHQNLNDIIDQIKPELKRSNQWPKASNKLTYKINEIVPNLKEKGIEITTGEKNSEGNRVIKIRKLQKKTDNTKKNTE
jgi:Txe/YoeB family toxin of Txe-Axe toxin-antitoxin module